LLANEGAHGLSHPKVDRHAEMPDGTTSFYFRTRNALLHGVAERVSELDMADIDEWARQAQLGPGAGQTTAALAQLVMQASSGPALMRARARVELTLHSNRDAVLGETMQLVTLQFYQLCRELISKANPDFPDTDPDLVDAQGVAVLTFIEGVYMSFVRGIPSIAGAEHLDSLLRAIIAGVTQTFSHQQR
jgi:hypothetical protein